MTSPAQTLCLCMIVKDEAPVIRRCLASVRSLIHHWIIVDTGSSDGTQAIVRAAMAGLPGELVERPWVDFAHNRSEALALARPHADYTLIIDADDALEIPDGFAMPPLTAGSYALRILDAGITYSRTQIVRNALPWRYEGVLHEYLTCEGAPDGGSVEGLAMRRNHDGARRRDPRTYRRDADLLERALTRETSPFLVARYRFYLAQSYRDCGMKEKALENYLARAELGFWIEEVFVALLNAARLREDLGHAEADVLATYERAGSTVPTRAEALHGAARFCRVRGRNAEGFAYAARGLAIQKPGDGLFLETWIYEYGLLDELAVTGYWAGRYEKCREACRTLLGKPEVPTTDKVRIAKNLEFAEAQLRRVSVASAIAVSDTTSWAPDRPLAGTELAVEGLRARLPEDIARIDLRINLYDPKHRDGRPLVLWFHHDVDQEAVQWCHDRTLTDPVVRFVFVSQWQLDRYVATFGLPSERCLVIRHAVDQEPNARRWEPAPTLRCAYTSTPFRGLDILLDAWDFLAPSDAELHVWSSMRLYQADDGPYKALLERARATSNVVYHGLVPNDELQAALRTMHFFTYPSTFAETACRAVVEAMAAGCRVIVPAYGALPETTAGYARVYPWSAHRGEHAARFAQVLADEFADPWKGQVELALAQQGHCATLHEWTRCLGEWRALIETLVEASVVPPASVPAESGTNLPRRNSAPERPIPAGEPFAVHLERLRERGFVPTGILDVGAYEGAFARLARHVFPQAYILMIDALSENEQVLQDVAHSLGNAARLIALVGDRADDATSFYVVDREVRPDLVKTGSSMFRENAPFPMEARVLATRTLADMIGPQPFQFLKLDIQGAELAAIRGLGPRLRDVEVILIEMSLVNYNDGAPLIDDVIAQLRADDFVLHDLVEMHRYPDGSLLQVDGLFVRSCSTLRPKPPFWS